MNFDSVFGVQSSFLITDYAVVGLCLGVILTFGLYHSIFSNASPEHFLVGARSNSTGSIAVSTAMLYFTVLTIIDSPADIYYYGIESFMFKIILVAVFPVSAFLFVPMMHKMQLTSIHQYIGHRFDSTTLRCITSFVYILQSLCTMIIVQVLASTALEKYFGVPNLTSMIGIGAFTAISISLGGFNANVWIQVFNFYWMILFLLVLALVSASKAGGIFHAFELAAENDRLKLFNFALDPYKHHNFYNFLFGYGFVVLMDLASNQSIVQRYSSLPTHKDAIKSIFLSIPLQLVPSLLCLLIGLFLQATYAGCDPMKVGKIDRPYDLLPHFVSKSMSFIPGIRGFFIGGILGNAISTCSTIITSLTACTYQDFIRKIWCRKIYERKTQNESATCCRLISLTYAVLATAITVLAGKFSFIEKIQLFSNNSYNLYVFSSVVIGPLAAVFIMAMFFPCVNKYGASIGFLFGVLCMSYMAVKVVALSTNIENFQMAPLSPIKGDCPDSAELNLTYFRFIPWHPKDDLLIGSENIDLITDEITTLSYLLFPLFGAILTIIISFTVSMFTGGLCLCASRKIPATMLHPSLGFSDCCIDSDERQLRHAISHRYVDRISSIHNIYPGNASRLDTKPPSYKYSSVPNTPSSWMN